MVLITGRSNRPLTEQDLRQVVNTFLGLDKEAPVRHGPGELTRCRVYEEDGEVICEIVFGPDIFPGKNVADPNSSLSMRAAAAHEITHFHRWKDKTELDGQQLMHIDEALTSLGAVQRFYEHLNDTEIYQLVSDAILRLQTFARGFDDPPEQPA
jgi:hypothetical protein